MAFDLIGNLIVPLVVGGGASSTIIFFGKNWLAKSIDHSFDKKIEDYKSVLSKENISYQIDKAEFSKKKFEHITALYVLILERKRRNEDASEFIGINSFQKVRKIYEENEEFDRKMQENISIASLFLDNSLIKLITSYKFQSRFIFLNWIQIEENRILENNYELQEKFVHLKVITNDNYNLEETTAHLNNKNELLKKTFDEINVGLKKFLAVE